MTQQCCFYCKARTGCTGVCINNPLFCTEFCAWLDDGCQGFEHDKAEYERIKAVFEGG